MTLESQDEDLQISKETEMLQKNFKFHFTLSCSLTKSFALHEYRSFLLVPKL